MGIPGVCRIKTRTRPATKAGVRMMFGKETKVKAASKDHCEGVPSCCSQEANLEKCSSLTPSRDHCLWESHRVFWGCLRSHKCTQQWSLSYQTLPCTHAA